VEEAVAVTKELYLRFTGQGISVIRMGLQGTADLQRPGSIVAGPYHPAFGHLVRSALFLDMIVRRVKTETRVPGWLELRVNPRDVSRAIGDNRQNIRILEDRFRLRTKVSPDSRIHEGGLEIVTIPSM
jgi:hypothetical protein